MMYVQSNYHKITEHIICRDNYFIFVIENSNNLKYFPLWT